MMTGYKLAKLLNEDHLLCSKIWIWE